LVEWLSSASIEDGTVLAESAVWIEQYDTSVRAAAFSFSISFGRFIAAGVNFALGAKISHTGILGNPVALTAIAFALGILALPFATETRGQPLPA